VIHKADIRDVWDYVRHGIQEIWDVSVPDWRPEDLYACCLYGHADVYLLGDTGGFVIVQERPMPFKNQKTLLLWVGYDKTGDAFRRHISDFEDLAAKRGCSAVEFWSSRKGMEKLSKRYGYSPYATIYTKVL
jgi:hypothetical protein